MSDVGNNGLDAGQEGSKLGAEQVADYLRQHPDFFINRDSLLADLTLPHESGEAISLLERQVSILRNRGIEARQKLNNLLENARNNDQLFDTTRNLVLALLRADDLTEVATVAQDQLSNHDNIDACELIIIEHPAAKTAPSIRTAPLATLRRDFGDVFRLKRTHCGPLAREQLDFLFPGTSRNIRSTALCPVISNSEVLALIGFGNSKENYFNIHLDTLFLDFIGRVVGAVMEKQITDPEKRSA